MNAILLDTSIVIDYLRRKNKEESIIYSLTSEELSISIITHTELFSGKSVWKVKRAQEELEELLSNIKVLLFTLETSKLAGKIRAMHHTDLFDAIIAATAIENGLQLVTLNTKHFENIQGLRLLQ